MSEEGGVWRTIGGRRVFIKDGDDLETAMKNSGKFNSKKEITEQGNSNRKEVREAIQGHIMEYYEDDKENFIHDMEAMNYGNNITPYSWGKELAKNGSFAISYYDQREFLDSLKINPKGKTFSDTQVFDMYVNLVGRESARLYEKFKNNKK